MIDNWEEKVRQTIEGFPLAHRDEILKVWQEWLDTNPQPPLYKNWSEYSVKLDDTEALYTERRVLLKRVSNELRDLEVPRSNWQKVAKALASVASLFLVLFLALSRVFRVAE